MLKLEEKTRVEKGSWLRQSAYSPSASTFRSIVLPDGSPNDTIFKRSRSETVTTVATRGDITLLLRCQLFELYNAIVFVVFVFTFRNFEPYDFHSFEVQSSNVVFVCVSNLRALERSRILHSESSNSRISTVRSPEL